MRDCVSKRRWGWWHGSVSKSICRITLITWVWFLGTMWKSQMQRFTPVTPAPALLRWELRWRSQENQLETIVCRARAEITKETLPSKQGRGAGDMSQQLRVPAALSGGLGSVSSTNTVAHSCLRLQFHRVQWLFWTLEVPGTYNLVLMYTHNIMKLKKKTQGRSKELLEVILWSPPVHGSTFTSPHTHRQ